MALIPCPECSQKISELAAVCPHCRSEWDGVCPECRSLRIPDSASCYQCGFPFSDTQQRQEDIELISDNAIEEIDDEVDEEEDDCPYGMKFYYFSVYIFYPLSTFLAYFFALDYFHHSLAIAWVAIWAAMILGLAMKKLWAWQLHMLMLWLALLGSFFPGDLVSDESRIIAIAVMAFFNLMLIAYWYQRKACFKQAGGMRIW